MRLNIKNIKMQFVQNRSVKKVGLKVRYWANCTNCTNSNNRLYTYEPHILILIINIYYLLIKQLSITPFTKNKICKMCSLAVLGELMHKISDYKLFKLHPTP